LDLLDRSNAADVLIAVALIDCDMPGTDGIALVEEIYRRYMSSSPRIVLLSSAGLAWSSGDRAITSDSRQADQPGPSVPDHQSSDNSFKSEFPYGSDTEASRLPTLRFGPARRMSRLLAEDNRINQEVVWRLLEKGVVTSSSPPMDSKPFEAFRSQAFDVVLMDVQMPGCSGLEAAARIRVHEAGRSRTPIIALTANCMSGDRERCVFAGMDGFLTKPFRAADLFEEIDRVSSLERIPQ
jgi:two-component system, sensor histidine kinase and response regulator